eukprot:tig00021517_g22002.t1
MGTSLKVQPFAGLIAKCGLRVPRLLINREEVGRFMAGGFDFGSEENYRDVPLLTDCDSGVLELCDKLGWREELLALAAEGGLSAPPAFALSPAASAAAEARRASEAHAHKDAAAAAAEAAEAAAAGKEEGCADAVYGENLAERELEASIAQIDDEAPPSPKGNHA